MANPSTLSIGKIESGPAASAAPAVVHPPAIITLDDRAARINEAHLATEGSLRQSANWGVITGLELIAANAALGERRGGNRSKTVSLTDLLPGEKAPAPKLTFPEWLRANCPKLKLGTAEFYMKMAKGAKGYLAKNGDEPIRLLLAKPANELDVEDLKLLTGSVRKTVDGKTYEQMALMFDIKGGKGKKKGKGTGDNGQDTKNANGEPPIGWSPEEWALRNAADPEAQEAIDIARPCETALLHIAESTTVLAHLPEHFRQTLAEAVALLTAKLATISAEQTKGPRK